MYMSSFSTGYYGPDVLQWYRDESIKLKNTVLTFALEKVSVQR